MNYSYDPDVCTGLNRTLPSWLTGLAPTTEDDDLPGKLKVRAPVHPPLNVPGLVYRYFVPIPVHRIVGAGATCYLLYVVAYALAVTSEGHYQDRNNSAKFFPETVQMKICSGALFINPLATMWNGMEWNGGGSCFIE
jgi:hypothetical protein